MLGFSPLAATPLASVLSTAKPGVLYAIIPWNEPPKPNIAAGLAIALIAAGQSHLPIGPFPELNTESRWHQAWSEPVRVKSGLAASTQAAPSYLVEFPPYAERVSLDKWLVALSEPVRVRPRLQDAAQQFLATAQPFVPSLDRWLYQLSEPVRQKPGLQAALHPFLAHVQARFPETVTVDRWLYPLAEPVRLKPGLRASLQAETSIFVKITPPIPDPKKPLYIKSLGGKGASLWKGRTS